MTKQREELIKRILESKKIEIKQAINNRATYDKWDKHSPIWSYSYVFNEEEEIKDIKRIEWLLKQPRSMYVNFFLNKEDMETYKWMYDFIGNEVDNAIMDSFRDSIDKFVDYRDLDVGDKNIYYAKE